MRKILLTTGLLLFVCQLVKAQPRMENLADSITYYLGLNIAEQYNGQLRYQLNPRLMAAALEDHNSGTSGLEEGELMDILSYLFSERIPEMRKQEESAYFTQLAKNRKLKTTESGLMYQIHKKGSKIRVTEDSDQIMVNYEGRFRDGEVFDSSYQRGEPSTFPIGSVIQGWQEGMRLIGEGGKITLYIPSELAYGSRGNHHIPPHEPLIFEVELLKVNPDED